MLGLTHHYEARALVQAPMNEVFSYMDDPLRLSSHMSKSSWMMGGGQMEIELDSGRGQNVGSRIRLAGKVFGIRLSVEEVVAERNPPHRKVWGTIGSPRLLAIGRYRMGFEVAPQGTGTLLRVHIDYALPESAPARWFGYLLGRCYARWCARRMVNDGVKHFALLSREQPILSSSSPQRGIR
ncbi:MAG TPA: SRPBCC family protein [Candidatus Binatia bacterium]